MSKRGVEPIRYGNTSTGAAQFFVRHFLDITDATFDLLQFQEERMTVGDEQHIRRTGDDAKSLIASAGDDIRAVVIEMTPPDITPRSERDVLDDVPLNTSFRHLRRREPILRRLTAFPRHLFCVT